MSLGKRLKEARKKKGWSQDDLVRESGVKQGTLSKIERGDQDKTTFIFDLATALECSPQWLESGKGDPYPSGKPLALASDSIQFKVLSATAGMGKGISEQLNHDFQIGKIESTKKWAAKYLSQASSLKNVRIITGLGDSMAPTFKEGDLLFVDTAIKGVDIDAIYAFSLDGELFIKRVARIRGGFEVISDNKRYKSWTLKKAEMKDVRVIGRVITKSNYEEL